MTTTAIAPQRRTAFRERSRQPLTSQTDGRVYIEDGIDSSDPWLYEADDNLPIPQERNLSVEELERMIVTDIRSIYAAKDAVQV